MWQGGELPAIQELAATAWGEKTASLQKELTQLVGEVAMTPRGGFGPWNTDTLWTFVAWGMPTPTGGVIKARTAR